MKKIVALMLALCMVCGVWVLAGAEADQATLENEILHGRTIPVELDGGTFRVPVITDTSWSDSHAYCGDLGGVAILLYSYQLDEEHIAFLNKEVAAFHQRGYSVNFQQVALTYCLYWSKQAADLAMDVGTNSVPCQIGMLNGDPVWSDGQITADGTVTYAQTYRNCTNVVVVISNNRISDEAAEQLGRQIMLSVRLDGVSEEDMMADAQADYVVITADSGRIRSEASLSGGLIRMAYKGEAFELIGEEGDWYIVDANGRTGYIHKGVAAIR